MFLVEGSAGYASKMYVNNLSADKYLSFSNCRSLQIWIQGGTIAQRLTHTCRTWFWFSNKSIIVYIFQCLVQLFLKSSIASTVIRFNEICAVTIVRTISSTVATGCEIKLSRALINILKFIETKEIILNSSI